MDPEQFEIDPMMDEMAPPEGAPLDEMFALPPEIVQLQQAVAQLQAWAGETNVADLLEDDQLASIGTKVVREYEIDRRSRDDWETKAKRGMEIARQEKSAKDHPWPGASNVRYPLLTTASLQFGARSYPAIVDGERVVKCKVMGADPDGQKAGAADRVSEHMSYQLLHETDWESDTDTMCHMLPIVGCCFKKIYPDPFKEAGFCSELVSAFDLVVNQAATSLEAVPRITHTFRLYPHEIAERQRSGRMRQVDIRREGDGDGEDDDAPHILLEQHRYLDLDGDGVDEPWIVTVHERTEQVLRITACYDPADLMEPTNVDMASGSIIRIPRRQYFVKVPFIPDPNGGFYDLGFGHLLGDLNEQVDTNINQMNDAATVQNAGGGFIGGGVDLGKGKAEVRIRPGEFRTVRAAGPDLRQSIVYHEHPGPSKTTFDLLSLMIQAGKDISGVQDIIVGDSPRVETATTTLAKIEQGMKVFTAIYKRIFRALKQEFRLIFEINKAALQDPMGAAAQKYAALLDLPPELILADYQGSLDITPIADPNNITDMQRMAKAQIVLDEVKAGNPHVNPFEATKRAFEAARVEKVEEVLIPPPPPDAPKEPSPEEKAAEIKLSEMQASLEAKVQEAQMRQQEMAAKLEAAQANLVMQFQARQREAEQKAIENELAHQQQLRALEVKTVELDQKWQELQLREEKLRVEAQARAVSDRS